MVKNYILHNREECIGCGACASLDPKNWKMSSEDGKSDLIDSEKTEENYKKEINETEIDFNVEVAESCPVNVIHIYKDSEKQI
ncbi:ferredoxin [archaeon]|jgi:ferredoxin|nr:ferredoxin [archaeon]MBT6824384.1 ferredoxin [archaeon]MBT7106934.1 ferredoxin [archaeon]MBT7297487.1 ferredoxin [archaeon]